MTYPTLVLSGSSSFLVSLIVFLRFLSIKRPIGFETTHKKVSHIGSILIWSFCLLVSSTIFVLTVPGIYHKNIYFVAIGVEVHVIYTFPIITTVIIYVILLYTLKQQSDTAMSEVTNRRLRSMANMTKGVVAGVIVCHVPLILWVHYWLQGYQGNSDAVFKSTFGVKKILSPTI